MNENFKPGFTYQEFARDFTGEHFNATEWVQLFAESGAKYLVVTSKHRKYGKIFGKLTETFKKIIQTMATLCGLQSIHLVGILSILVCIGMSCVRNFGVFCFLSFLCANFANYNHSRAG